MDGWLVHYNYFRPHMSLRDRTPASVAGIRFPFRNWKDVVEQPYKITARIPIERVLMPTDYDEPIKPKPKHRKVLKRKTIKKKKPTANILSNIRGGV